MTAPQPQKAAPPSTGETAARPGVKGDLPGAWRHRGQRLGHLLGQGLGDLSVETGGQGGLTIGPGPHDPLGEGNTVNVM